MKKKYAVIGHPIAHTMSPFIHSKLFELAGIDAEYGVLDISPENLGTEYGNTLKKLDGYNITIPHKQAIIPYLNALDDKARMYGSVNTVLNSGGKSKGFTTDPDGFIKAADYAGIPLDGRVVILGCGGVARTMAYEALFRGAELEFAVREKSIEKVKKLISEIKDNIDNPKVGFCIVDELTGDIDTLVNATPVGMSPNTDLMPVSEAQLKNCANVYDAVYNPLDTLLIKTARKNGSNAESGMSMLVWQAAAAQYHWNGSEFDKKDIENLCVLAGEELKKR